MTKICALDECTIEFESRQPLAKFCSPRHQQKAAWRRKHNTRVGDTECARPDCKVMFLALDKRKKYCSRSCAAIANNELRSLAKPKRFCYCGAELTWWQETACSVEHAARRRSDSYVQRWLAGEETGSQDSGNISSTVRNYLLERADYRCQSPTCAVPGGWSVPNPITGKPILTVDHIDGNWKNNAVDNLIVLCYSCHTLTPTFGALNVGNKSGSRPFRDARKR